MILKDQSTQILIHLVELMIGNLIVKINNSLVFGYGAQGDRYLINQTASNGMIYAITSSGIFGLISFIFFNQLFMDSFEKFLIC